jgi:parallel beta-helix repeat protein
VSDPGHDAVNGTWTIRPKTPFRVLTDGPLVIDGQSQAGFIGGDPNPYGPEIEINGADLSRVPALAITGSDVQVAALTINRCKSAAVMFQATLRGKLLGCYLGTTPDGMAAAGNEYGVWILQKARDIMVGDASDPQVGNLLSGNETGVLVTDSCRNVRIGGNRIGVKRTGTDSLGNTVAGIGVQVGSDSTTISGNRIGGKGTGIYVSGSTRCSIYGNSIGTDTAGAHRLGKFSQGVFFDYYARDNVAASNVIANCVRAGIMVFGSGCVRDRLTMNRIFGIAGKAIETSFGGNVGVQKPSILSVSLTSVTGTTFPGASIEVFADDSMQARHFCGSTKANASGGFVLQLPHTISWRYVTATATDSAGNTSELSAPFVLTDVNGEPVTEVPADFRLERNYPNPFNPNTVVSYQLPVASQVKLVVYDLLGREVAVLVDAQMPAGEYRATFHGALQASGTYVVRLKAGAFTASRKMLLAK